MYVLISVGKVSSVEIFETDDKKFGNAGERERNL